MDSFDAEYTIQFRQARNSSWAMRFLCIAVVLPRDEVSRVEFQNFSIQRRQHRALHAGSELLPVYRGWSRLQTPMADYLRPQRLSRQHFDRRLHEALSWRIKDPAQSSSATLLPPDFTSITWERTASAGDRSSHPICYRHQSQCHRRVMPREAAQERAAKYCRGFPCYFHSHPLVWVFPSASTSNSKSWATVLSRANLEAAEL